MSDFPTDNTYGAPLCVKTTTHAALTKDEAHRVDRACTKAKALPRAQVVIYWTRDGRMTTKLLNLLEEL